MLSPISTKNMCSRSKKCKNLISFGWHIFNVQERNRYIIFGTNRGSRCLYWALERIVLSHGRIRINWQTGQHDPCDGMFGISRVSPRARSWSELPIGSVRPRASTCSCRTVRCSCDNARDREKFKVAGFEYYLNFRALKATRNWSLDCCACKWFWGKFEGYWSSNHRYLLMTGQWGN